MDAHKLIPHPDTPCDAVRGIEVNVHLAPSGDLILTYTLKADLAALRIPPAMTPARGKDLWKRTCLEAFLQGEDAPAYREFNFSPSGQWQAYAFTDYRQGGPLALAPAPTMGRIDKDGRITLKCKLPAEALPKGTLLRLGITAVIEDVDGGLSFWSPRHPPGEPDFHHTDNFALTFSRP
ncbi:MAG: DOMON-like domain-containing protein [Thiobacillus sp.]|nr:DOMON-like domain-containing protein [Thiobacillus sp.]